MLLRLLLLGASAYVGYKLGYNDGKETEKIRSSSYEPSLSTKICNLANKTAQVVKNAKDGISNSKEFKDVKQSLTVEEITNIVKNNLELAKDIVQKNLNQQQSNTSPVQSGYIYDAFTSDCRSKNNPGSNVTITKNS